MRRIADDLTSYYLLGYYSTNAKLDGGYRALRVRVKTPGVQVRARRGYRAATAAEVSAAKEAASVAVPEGTAAVTAAVSELARIRPDMPFVVRAVPSATAGATEIRAVWVAGELQGREAPAGGSATIEITGGGSTTTAKVELKAAERAFMIRVPLDKPLAQADVRARFVPLNSPGTPPLTYTLKIVAPTGLPAPLLYRRGQATGNRLQPVAGFQFTRNERLRLELPLDAADKPGAGRFLDRTGQPMQIPVTVGERTDAETGQRWMTADVMLAALAAGDYAVELAATSGSTERKAITPFRIVAR
jgi:hypothetical protein